MGRLPIDGATLPSVPLWNHYCVIDLFAYEWSSWLLYILVETCSLMHQGHPCFQLMDHWFLSGLRYHIGVVFLRVHLIFVLHVWILSLPWRQLSVAVLLSARWFSRLVVEVCYHLLPTWLYQLLMNSTDHWRRPSSFATTLVLYMSTNLIANLSR